MKYGYCPKCHDMRHLTRHHVFPRRFFGNKNTILLICQTCHDDIESIIPVRNKLTKGEYLQITKDWLLGLKGGEHETVVVP